MAEAFTPGDHGTTFGGNPLATAAGLAVFDIYEEENLVENSKKMGELFKAELSNLMNKYPEKIVDVRGAGLLVGAELIPEIAKDVFNALFKKGFLTSLCGNTLRLAPPLIITEKEIKLFIDTLDEILKG